MPPFKMAIYSMAASTPCSFLRPSMSRTMRGLLPLRLQPSTAHALRTARPCRLVLHGNPHRHRHSPPPRWHRPRPRLAIGTASAAASVTARMLDSVVGILLASAVCLAATQLQPPLLVPLPSSPPLPPTLPSAPPSPSLSAAVPTIAFAIASVAQLAAPNFTARSCSRAAWRLAACSPPCVCVVAAEQLALSSQLGSCSRTALSLALAARSLRSSELDSSRCSSSQCSPQPQSQPQHQLVAA